MIQWFSKNSKTMIASFYPTNITINKPGLEKLSDAYAAMVGIDAEEKKVVIKPLSKDEYDKNVYPSDALFVLSGGKTYTRISSTEFVSEVSAQLSLSFKDKVRKFLCYYDSKNDMLIVDMEKEVTAND